MISVDSKKKELVGNYNNTGQEYHKKGNAPKVNIYDFVKKTESGQYNKATPYGVYDITLNSGWVNVGISSDTAEFAVNTIRIGGMRLVNKSIANLKNYISTLTEAVAMVLG